MIETLRSLLAALLGVLQARLSVWADGWASGLLRCAMLLYWLWLSVFFLMLASGLLVAAMLLAFWEQRVLVLAALAMIALLLWAWSFWQWQRALHRPH